MTEILRPTKFQPVFLSTLDVGPLRGMTSLSLRDATGQPTNLYLIMGPNGAGKTTILETIYAAMSLLSARAHPSTGIEAIDTGDGGFQFDALVQLDDGTKSYLRVLSIVAGKQGLLRAWSGQDLEAVGAERQIVLAFGRRSSTAPIEVLPSSDLEAFGFFDSVQERMGESPLSLFGSSITLPTVLYFPSDRGIRRPPVGGRNIVRPEMLGYAPARRFDADGATWADSIENLLVWFTWLEDDRDKMCRDLVNDLVFRRHKTLGAVDRHNLAVPVQTDSGSHRLDQLSSGERQLVQLIVRIAAHMTSSTIVLIDETEQHLHLTMRRRLITLIKDWARDHEGLRFVMTSHQADSMRLLAPKTVEPGLYKSGCLVKPKFVPPHG